jgi:hypothetical protein
MVSLVLRRHPRPSHPAPTFVTMANAPLIGTGWQKLPQFPIFGKRYFWRQDWTPKSA